jgi:predicted RNA methylase
MDKTIRFNAIVREIMKLENASHVYSLFQFQSFVSASQYFRLYNLFTKYVPTNSKVLDWGCGNGHFSYLAVALPPKLCYPDQVHEENLAK